MSNYMNLIGAHDVGVAGSQIQSAAEEMKRAAGYFDDALRQHQNFMNDWLQRLETIMQPQPTNQQKGETPCH